MTRSKVKVNVTKVRNLRKWMISKSISSAGMLAIKRLLVNYDTARQCLTLKRTNASAQYVWSEFKIREGSPDGTRKTMEDRIRGTDGVVCFSFFFWLRVLDKAEYSAFESTLSLE